MLTNLFFASEEIGEETGRQKQETLQEVIVEKKMKRRQFFSRCFLCLHLNLVLIVSCCCCSWTKDHVSVRFFSCSAVSFKIVSQGEEDTSQQDEADKRSDYFTWNHLTFCVWDVPSTEESKKEEAKRKENETREKRMTVVVDLFTSIKRIVWSSSGSSLFQ